MENNDDFECRIIHNFKREKPLDLIIRYEDHSDQNMYQNDNIMYFIKKIIIYNIFSYNSLIYRFENQSIRKTKRVGVSDYKTWEEL